jgi:LCP family protein required for cell wall assembly
VLLGAILAAALLAYGLLMIESPRNILILGIDRRPGEGNAVRTDTILLVRSDFSGSRLVLLSIPRDLWVTIPGEGSDRINTAHLYGELAAPGNGPQRTIETIQHNFNIPIHHVLRLNFSAFRDVIDAAGGIDLEVPVAIIDDAYPTDDYGTLHIEIPAGPQHMDGETALRYARSRHGSSDFARAARQQQIIIALITKMSSPSGLLRAPQVYQAFNQAVETDMRLRDLFRLALAWLRAGQQGTQQIVINQDLTTPHRTAQGAAVLLPRWDSIRPMIQAQFGPQSGPQIEP